MEARAGLNQNLPRNGIGGRENLKRGMDQKIPLMLSAVERKRLSDITNTVSSGVAISDAQFQEKSKEVACGITKECIGQLMEENATLLKALGERNKIIELSGIELQKLRLLVQKTSQQNWMLAQANSQMLAELTSSKVRLKALQHELGCALAVLRLKNLELDGKEKLNKEPSEKVMIQEGRSKLVEVATDVRQTQSVCNSTACRLDGISQSNEEKLDNELCEKMKTKENSTFMEVATAAALTHSLTNSMACNPNRRHTLRNKSSTTLPWEAEEKVTNELHVKTRAEEERLNREPCENDSVEEEHSECAKAAIDASLSHAVDNMSCEPNRKRTLRSQSLGAAVAVTHQVEAKGKVARAKEDHSECAKAATDASLSHAVDNMSCKSNRKRTLRSQSLGAAVAVTHRVEAKEKYARRKYSRRRSNNLTSEAHESKDDLPEIENLEVPACPVINEPPIEDNTVQSKPSATTSHQVEAEDNYETRSRKTSRRRSNNLTSKARESKDNVPVIENVEVPASPVIIEHPNEDNPAQAKSSATVSSQAETEGKNDARTRKSLRRRSNNLTSEARESKDDLPAVENVKVPACPVISELPNEDNPVQAKSSATVRSPIEAAEREDARITKSTRRRSSNQKSEPCESKDHYPETADVKNLACPPITEPPNEDNPVQERTSAPSNSDASLKHEEIKAQKDQPTSSQIQGQELRRTSVGRPMRRAAEKVCSYKEVPLNVKMRRAK